METSRMDQRAPLVSVIVRTLGRPTLARSIASLSAQTYRPLEIVIVNAGATILIPPRTPPGVRCRVVDGGPYDRPQAANAGLAAASGEWLAFLDDDDAFLPTHIESLWRMATASDGALVAYSATQCLDEHGRPDIVIGSGFDRLKLFSMNYIQIGAALFAQSLVSQGCRFDEEFECMQDWDFWLQLAQRTHFVHTGEATNLWSAFGGGSGCGMGANTDSALQARYFRAPHPQVESAR
jgi:glycosyltransferase involved in cell wall biosynthesis